MLALLNNLFPIFLSLAQAQDITCINSKISLIEFGKSKNQSAFFCFNEDKTILLSKNCIKKKCSAFIYPHKFKIDQLLSQNGKPSFQLCRELSGKPELLEFYVENKAYKLDRCLFSDGSFVDTDFLLSHYLEK